MSIGIVSAARTTGDVLGRLLTRVDEIQNSVALLVQYLETDPPLGAETGKPTWLAAGPTSGVGLVEG
ncbi:hypothetical protein OG809_22440 [Kribbella soli]